MKVFYEESEKEKLGDFKFDKKVNKLFEEEAYCIYLDNQIPMLIAGIIASLGITSTAIGLVSSQTSPAIQNMQRRIQQKHEENLAKKYEKIGVTIAEDNKSITINGVKFILDEKQNHN